MDYSCFDNIKKFSAGKAEIFSLTDLSLILEALVKYKNFNVTDPSKAKLVKAMTDAGAQLTALINETPDADNFSLKGFTGKDISAMLAAIAWLDIDPKADPEIGELVKRLKKLRGKVNFKKGAAITGTVAGTAAVVAASAIAIKALHEHNKKVRNEREVLEAFQQQADNFNVSLYDVLKSAETDATVPEDTKAIVVSLLSKIKGPDLNSVARSIASGLQQGATNA